MKLNKTQDAFLRLHIGVLIAGGTGLFGRLISVGELPLVGIRVILGAVILALLMAFRHTLQRISWSHIWKIAGCGMLLSIHWVLYYGSIKAANISIGAICFALVGFMTALIEPLFNRYRPRWNEILLGILAVIGIGLIFGVDSRYRLGITIGILSSLVYTIFSIFSKRVQAETRESSSTMLLYELIGGTVILFIALPFYARLFPNIGIIPQGNDWWYLLLFATVFTIIPFLLQLQALRQISAFTVNLTYNLEPVYTIFFAMLIFHEASELNWSFWVGILLIIISVALQALHSLQMHPPQKNAPNKSYNTISQT